MDDLRDRVEAVERALTDGDGDLTALAEGAARAERVEELEAAIEELRDDVAELEAATQALRGYVGNVRSVNESVEQRADAAVAAVESLEARVDRLAEAGSASVDEPVAHHSTDPDRAVGSGATPSRDGVEGQAGSDGHADVCRTCGRAGVDAQPAADGGSPDRRPAGHAGASGRTEPDVESDAPTGAGTGVGRQSLGEFDPAEGSHRVSIEAREAQNAAEDERAGDRGLGRNGATSSPGLLARVRELL